MTDYRKHAWMVPDVDSLVFTFPGVNPAQTVDIKSQRQTAPRANQRPFQSLKSTLSKELVRSLSHQHQSQSDPSVYVSVWLPKRPHFS